MEDLEALIRRYVVLGKLSPKGFEVVKCQACHDHSERGGFKFEDGTVVYHCFNCSETAVYDPLKNKHTVPRNMKKILLAFGIPEEEIVKTISFNFFKPQDKQAAQSETKPTGLELPSKEAPLPTGSVLVSSGQNEWCEVAERYLQSRSLKVSDLDWYVTNETSYVGRLLIPYVFRGKTIYWQGRSLYDELISPRYKNPSIVKDNIFFNMDELYRYTDEPLFVTEGPLDAVSIGKNAVALTGSTLTEFKRAELRKVAQRRRVIFVIDKNLNGAKLGKEVLAGPDNWFVACFPDNYEDANDALQQLGRLWVITHLSSVACRELQGKMMLRLNCST